MEARKITIVSTQTQQKNVIMSEAETLGQLKADLDNAGISYYNMTFYEGVSKTELKHDDSVLPTNVPYTNRRTGVTTNTNELVFMLTNMDKKIASGMTRKDAYEIIKDFNLQDEIKNIFGRNFTQVSTDNLEKILANRGYGPERHPICSCDDEEIIEIDLADAPEITSIRGAIIKLLDYLVEGDCIYESERSDVEQILLGKTAKKSKLVSPYDDDEIESMIDDCMA